ncbi:MAG: aminoacyl-tRNA hydrolase [Bacteroidota bacterium]
MKYLIVGLGNIGPEYAFTRHNMGFMVLDQLAALQQTTFQPGRLATTANCSYRGRSLFLVKPTTYMNHSGQAMVYWLNKLKLPVEQSLVIVDDIALPLGNLRMRAQGKHAGHNGLKSIEASLGTPAYPRLRVGIGRNFRPGQQASYVLAPFTPQEQLSLPAVIDQACKITHDYCMLGIVRAMEQHNRASASPLSDESLLP